MRKKKRIWVFVFSVVLVLLLIGIFFFYVSLYGPDFSERYSSGEVLLSPVEGLSNEQAVLQFDESFVYYFLVNIEAYNLHNPPLSSNKPKVVMFVGDEVYNAVVTRGVIEVSRGDLSEKDMIFRTTTLEAVKMIRDDGYIAESFQSGRSGIELVEEKATLFAKGYLKIYTKLTGQSITGSVFRIYSD